MFGLYYIEVSMLQLRRDIMARKSNMFENLALVSQIGISMIVPIMLGLYIGKWLDDRLGTRPIFLFAFIIIGVISGFTNLFHMTKKDFKSRKRK